MRYKAEVDFKKTKLSLIETGLVGIAKRRALLKIGARLVASTQARFRSESFMGKRWSARSVPNTMGVLSDLAGGGNPKARRFKDRPTLADTGRLKRSINSKMEGDSVVRVGTSVPYASVQNYGGRSQDIKITKDMRIRLAKWLRRNTKWAAPLSFIFRRSSHSVNVIARKFIGIDKRDQRDVVEIVRRQMLMLGGGPTPKGGTP